MTDDEPVVSAYEVRPAALEHTCGLMVRGELDLRTAPDLSERLDAAIRESDGTFAIDLTELAFLDSTGITVFVRARALLGREERELVIVCPPGPVRRVFELAGCGDLFAIVDAPADAAAGGVGVGHARSRPAADAEARAALGSDDRPQRVLARLEVDVAGAGRRGDRPRGVR